MGLFVCSQENVAMMKTVLFSALLALSAAKSVHMTLPRGFDTAPKLLASASDCECSGDCGSGPDMTKCNSKQPQGMAILECWDGSKITCEKKDCKEWVDCIVKEFFDKTFNENCEAKCDIFPLLIVIVVVVVVLLLAVAVFCSYKKKKAAGGAAGPKANSGGL